MNVRRLGTGLQGSNVSSLGAMGTVEEESSLTAFLSELTAPTPEVPGDAVHLGILPAGTEPGASALIRR